ncbi:MAG: hypothetical protein ACXADY_26290, partial [Candidatus Hodarchaeales archaeon]
MHDTDQVIDVLVRLRKALKSYLDPKVLGKLADFLENTGGDRSMIERYIWFSENSEEGSNCRYAIMAKEFFLKENAKDVARTIN